MEKRLKAPLQAAVKFLEDSGYRYAVIGGIALSQWGVVRITRDVDLKVLVPDTDYESIRKAIRTAFPNRARQDARENPLIISVIIHDVIIDFLLAVPGYEELIIKRAKCRRLDGISALVCSAEDLIIQKAIAGRGRDWPDIEALLIEQRGKLDEGYIEDWLTQFSEALGNPDIILQYQRLNKKIQDLSE